MTLMEAIQQVDALKPNAYSVRQKILWLSQLEAMVGRLVTGQEWNPSEEFMDETDPGTRLTMAAPFDMAYLYWLEAQIHYANEDLDLYNRAIVLFNRVFGEYKADYRRNHGGEITGRFRF